MEDDAARARAGAIAKDEEGARPDGPCDGFVERQGKRDLGRELHLIAIDLAKAAHELRLGFDVVHGLHCGARAS